MVSQFGQGKGGGQGYRENLQFLCGLVNSVFFSFLGLFVVAVFLGGKKICCQGGHIHYICFSCCQGRHTHGIFLSTMALKYLDREC